MSTVFLPMPGKRMVIFTLEVMLALLLAQDLPPSRWPQARTLARAENMALWPGAGLITEIVAEPLSEAPVPAKVQLPPTLTLPATTSWPLMPPAPSQRSAAVSVKRVVLLLVCWMRAVPDSALPPLAFCQLPQTRSASMVSQAAWAASAAAVVRAACCPTAPPRWASRRADQPLR